MEPEEAVVVYETVLGEEEIEPFNWEDHLYESWLEERRGRKARKYVEPRT